MEHGATPFLFSLIDNLWDELRDNPRYISATKKITYSIDELRVEDIPKKYKKSTLSKKQAEFIKKELEGCLAFRKKLEEDSSESDKREMAQVSPLLERIEDLVNGDLELPSNTIETAVETNNEYIKALNEFSEDQFEAFLMGVGANWLNLPYWGVPGLKFQCKKIEDWLIEHKDLESKDSGQKRRTYEKRNLYNALPIYNHSRKLLHSEVLANALSFFKSMLQVLSTRSF